MDSRLRGNDKKKVIILKLYWYWLSQTDCKSNTFGRLCKMKLRAVKNVAREFGLFGKSPIFAGSIRIMHKF
jgi:hypothetical protein